MKTARFKKLRKVLCALLGHPPVVEMCFGYVYCARCREQLGDVLGGVYPLREKRVIRHPSDCQHCNAVKLKWHQKILVGR